MALEQARLSVELAMQVRSRIVEGYREIMNIPL
jgi:flagellar hook-basal body complex protein FliE